MHPTVGNSRGRTPPPKILREGGGVPRRACIVAGAGARNVPSTQAVLFPPTKRGGREAGAWAAVDRLGTLLTRSRDGGGFAPPTQINNQIYHRLTLQTPNNENYTYPIPKHSSKVFTT